MSSSSSSSILGGLILSTNDSKTYLRISPTELNHPVSSLSKVFIRLGVSASGWYSVCQILYELERVSDVDELCLYALSTFAPSSDNDAISPSLRSDLLKFHVMRLTLGVYGKLPGFDLASFLSSLPSYAANDVRICLLQAIYSLRQHYRFLQSSSSSSDAEAKLQEAMSLLSAIATNPSSDEYFGFRDIVKSFVNLAQKNVGGAFRHLSSSSVRDSACWVFASRLGLHAGRVDVASRCLNAARISDPNNVSVDVQSCLSTPAKFLSSFSDELVKNSQDIASILWSLPVTFLIYLAELLRSCNHATLADFIFERLNQEEVFYSSCSVASFLKFESVRKLQREYKYFEALQLIDEINRNATSKSIHQNLIAFSRCQCVFALAKLRSLHQKIQNGRYDLKSEALYKLASPVSHENCQNSEFYSFTWTETLKLVEESLDRLSSTKSEKILKLCARTCLEVAKEEAEESDKERLLLRVVAYCQQVNCYKLTSIELEEYNGLKKKHVHENISEDSMAELIKYAIEMNGGDADTNLMHAEAFELLRGPLWDSKCMKLLAAVVVEKIKNKQVISGGLWNNLGVLCAINKRTTLSEDCLKKSSKFYSQNVTLFEKYLKTLSSDAKNKIEEEDNENNNNENNNNENNNNTETKEAENKKAEIIEEDSEDKKDQKTTVLNAKNKKLLELYKANFAQTTFNMALMCHQSGLHVKSHQCINLVHDLAPMHFDALALKILMSIERNKFADLNSRLKSIESKKLHETDKNMAMMRLELINLIRGSEALHEEASALDKSDFFSKDARLPVLLGCVAFNGVSLLITRGELKRANEKLKYAENQFMKGLANDSHNVAALNGLAAVACMRRNFNFSTVLSRQILSAGVPSFEPSAHKNLGHAFLSDACIKYTEKRDQSKSISDRYRNSISSDMTVESARETIKSLMDHASVSLDASLYDKVLHHYHLTLQKLPQDRLTNLLLALSHCRSNDWDAAIRVMRSSMASNPNDLRLRWNYFLIMWKSVVHDVDLITISFQKKRIIQLNSNLERESFLSQTEDEKKLFDAVHWADNQSKLKTCIKGMQQIASFVTENYNEACKQKLACFKPLEVERLIKHDKLNEVYQRGARYAAAPIINTIMHPLCAGGPDNAIKSISEFTSEKKLKNLVAECEETEKIVENFMPLILNESKQIQAEKLKKIERDTEKTLQIEKEKLLQQEQKLALEKKREEEEERVAHMNALISHT